MASKRVLTEDEIDDILYLARVNEASELEDFLSTLSSQHKSSKGTILEAAVDGETGNNVLHYAAANGHIEILKLLQPYLSELTSESTPDEASKSDDANQTSRLPLLNSQNDSGNTPLHWAALNGHLPFVKLAVKLGAEITTLNKAGHDALFEAELAGKEDIVAWLLVEGEGIEQAIGGGGDEETVEGEDNGTTDKTESVNAVGEKLSKVGVGD